MSCIAPVFPSLCCSLRRFSSPVASSLATPLPHPLSFALIPTGGRFLLPQGMALSGRPRRAGPPSPSRPAGRSRPRGPEPLYTVRRDPDGHGALAATGDARPMVTTALSGPGGDVPLRPDPSATTGGHALPRCPATHSRSRRGYTVWLCADKAVTVHPRPACGRVGRAARAGARQGRDRPTLFLMGDGPSPKATVYGPTGHNKRSEQKNISI